MATTFYNQATLSYNGISTTSNTVSGEIVTVLNATKNSLTDTYNFDSDMTYVINLVNTGTVPLNTITLSDDLGAYDYTPGRSVTPLTYQPGTLQYYVNGVLQPTPAVTDTPTLTVTNLSIPAGANATVIYQARVNDFASPETTGNIVNTVTLSGDALATDVTAASTVTTSADPILSIMKAVSPASVSENGELTYVFTVENIGNTAADAGDSIVISDVFNPILTSPTVSLDGVALTEGTDYTYNAATGEFQTVAGRITVPAATYSLNADTGAWVVTPGSSALTVTGTI